MGRGAGAEGGEKWFSLLDNASDTNKSNGSSHSVSSQEIIGCYDRITTKVGEAEKKIAHTLYESIKQTSGSESSNRPKIRLDAKYLTRLCNEQQVDPKAVWKLAFKKVIEELKLRE